jgi:hypothetical protein
MFIGALKGAEILQSNPSPPPCLWAGKPSLCRCLLYPSAPVPPEPRPVPQVGCTGSQGVWLGVRDLGTSGPPFSLGFSPIISIITRRQVAMNTPVHR